MHIFDDYSGFLDDAKEMEEKVKVENPTATILYQIPDDDKDMEPAFFLSTDNPSYQDLFYSALNSIYLLSGELFKGIVYLWNSVDGYMDKWDFNSTVVEKLEAGEYKLVVEFLEDSDITTVWTLYVAEIYSMMRVLNGFTESEKVTMMTRDAMKAEDNPTEYDFWFHTTENLVYEGMVHQKLVASPEWVREAVIDYCIQFESRLDSYGFLQEVDGKFICPELDNDTDEGWDKMEEDFRNRSLGFYFHLDAKQLQEGETIEYFISELSKTLMNAAITHSQSTQ